MNRQEYLNQSQNKLQRCDAEFIAEITRDLNEHFEQGIQNGKTDDKYVDATTVTYNITAKSFYNLTINTAALINYKNNSSNILFEPATTVLTNSPAVVAINNMVNSADSPGFKTPLKKNVLFCIVESSPS